MIVIRILWSLVTIAVVIIATGVSFTFLSDFRNDYQVFKNGKKVKGICLKRIRRGKEYYSEVEWVDDDITYSNEFLILPKLKPYPYNIIVYIWNYKANLGIYTLLYDLSMVLLAAFIAVMGIITFFEEFIFN